jgi:hypothetical protein
MVGDVMAIVGSAPPPASPLLLPELLPELLPLLDPLLLPLLDPLLLPLLDPLLLLLVPPSLPPLLLLLLQAATDSANEEPTQAATIDQFRLRSFMVVLPGAACAPCPKRTSSADAARSVSPAFPSEQGRVASRARNLLGLARSTARLERVVRRVTLHDGRARASRRPSWRSSRRDAAGPIVSLLMNAARAAQSLACSRTQPGRPDR